MKHLLPFLFFALLISCNKDSNVDSEPSDQSELYFPPTDSDDWESTSISELGWNESQVDDFYDYLSSKGTRAFIILKDGKMVMEKYWGNNILDTTPFGQETLWYWASAGKSLTATLVGIAQEEGLLDIDDKTTDYLGSNWTSLATEQEEQITIRNQLTMTTGLDYSFGDVDCTDPSCLVYKEDPDTQWFYHNAPYTLLGDVVSNAAGIDYNNFTNQKVASIIGMPSGQWIPLGYNNVYWSTARDMARFGLLTLNKGAWDGMEVLADKEYYEDMVNSSQELNPSYGYLWWLNGKSSIVFPGLETSFNVELSAEAPEDLFAAVGKNGQIIDIVPSQNLVVIRMGEAPDNALVPVSFHNEMWEQLNAIIQ